MDQTGFWLLITIVCGAVWLFSVLRTAAKNKKVTANREKFMRERDGLIASGNWNKLLHELTMLATGIFASGKIFEADNFTYLKKVMEDIIAYGPKCDAVNIDVATLKETLDVFISVNEGKAKDIDKVKEYSQKGTKIITDAYGELSLKYGDN
jgi:hypothetical protein